MKSALGSIETVTLYVDRMTADETLSKYFGDGFIDGKRIYSEGTYPTYEGGYTKYKIQKITDEYQPLYGEITNLTTGKTIEIVSNGSGTSGEISEAGEYCVVLHNNPTFKTDVSSGDDKEITFHFNIIAKGTAPGPQVNQKSLDDYVKNGVSGIYPKYYGLVYQSAGKGYIIKAFASWEAARNYAYKNESGMVEVQKDGTYLYTNSNIIVPKTRYDSIQDLTDARNKAADEAVFEMYIDASDDVTYITLKDDVIEKHENLRELTLSRSVFVIAEGEESKLRNLSALPILNPVTKVYLTPGKDGEAKEESSSFIFVRDKYGCDSDKIVITDSNGKKFDIDYKKAVDVQLKEQGCSTGIVTIDESTIYGDSTKYEAVYFAGTDNTAQLSIQYSENNEKKKTSITQKDNGLMMHADYFSIEKIEDDLDPYSFVVIKDPSGSSSAYVADKNTNIVWSDNGIYEVEVINRIGNKYSFGIEVNNTEYATISFQGEGTDVFEPVVKRKGDKDVSLPTPERYGYDFAGYIDEKGTVYKEVIERIDFSGTRVLCPIWKAKGLKLILKDADGKVIDEMQVGYGAEISLPLPEIAKGYEFTGWQKEDGEIITDGTIKISDEKDVTLIATVTESKVDGNTQRRIEPDGSKEKRKLPVAKIGIVFILGILGFANRKRIAALWNKKNGDDIEKTEMHIATNEEEQISKDEEDDKNEDK